MNTLGNERPADSGDADAHDGGDAGNVDHEGEVGRSEADDELLEDDSGDGEESDGHVVHLESVGEERKNHVLGAYTEQTKQSNVSSEHLVAPAVLPPEVEIHGGTFSSDQKYFQQEATA